MGQTRPFNVQITLHFDRPCPPPPRRGKFVVGKGSNFILQPMANTNHKFPATGGGGGICEVKSTVQQLSEIRSAVTGNL